MVSEQIIVKDFKTIAGAGVGSFELTLAFIDHGMNEGKTLKECMGIDETYDPALQKRIMMVKRLTKGGTQSSPLGAAVLRTKIAKDKGKGRPKQVFLTAKGRKAFNNLIDPENVIRVCKLFLSAGVSKVGQGIVFISHARLETTANEVTGLTSVSDEYRSWYNTVRRLSKGGHSGDGTGFGLLKLSRGRTYPKVISPTSKGKKLIDRILLDGTD